MNAVGKIGYRYRLGEQLGEGGMGAVYRAYDRLNGTEVALKQVNIPLEFLEFMSRASLGATTGLWMALAEEFKTLASLRHPHIISVMDYGFDTHRQPYYTMELLSQPTNLLDYGSDLTVPEKINLLIQVLQALAYLHRRGVIHRDLKPDNVLVVGGQAKVLDFGLAITRRQQTEDTPAGTLHYMAPEVLNGQSASFSSDLYAVGVMAYQLFALTLPFDSDDGLENLIEAVTTQLADVNPLPIDAALKDVIGRLLAKTPADRYTNATEAMIALSQAVGQLPPSETVALRESFIQSAEFVGRQQELRQLKDALQEAMNSKGSAWLVGGEGGVGKSRLLDELRTQALVDGALVVRGQAVEGGGLPYQLWREPLRRLVLSVELSDLEASVLKPIVADISSLLERDIPDAPELPGEAGQQRLVQTIMDVIRRQPHPMVLLLEDLQWSEESLEPLKRLTPLLADLPLLMVANYRSDERPDLPDNLPGMTPMSLMRLSTAEVAELSAGMLGEGGRDPAIIDRLQQETEGNTFFMVEVVRALAEAAGRLDDIRQMTLPRTIFAGGIVKIVQRRLNRVPEWGQELLKLAAVVGRQLDLPLLRHVLASGICSLEGFAIDQWLSVCADVAVLDIQDEHWRFAHDKLRETLLQNLDPEQTGIISQAIAETIEAVYLNDDSQASRLSTYWLQAGNLVKAGHYGEIAGEQALSRAAYREAVTQFERALASLPVDSQDVRRGRLLTRYGGALRGIGEIERSLLMIKEALALGKLTGDLHVQFAALEGLGTDAMWRDEFDLAEDYFQQAVAIAEPLGENRRAASIKMSIGGIHMRRLNYKGAEVKFRELLEFAKNSTDELLLGRACGNLALIAEIKGDLSTALARHQEAFSHFDKVGHQEFRAQALSLIGATLVALERSTEAKPYYERALTIARTAGAQRMVATVLGNMASLAMALNELNQAETYGLESLAMARQAHYTALVISNLINLEYVYRQQHKLNLCRSCIREALDISIENDSYDALTLIVVAGSACDVLGKTALAYELFDYAIKHPDLHQGNFNDEDRARIAAMREELGEQAEQIEARNKGRDINELIVLMKEDLADVLPFSQLSLQQ